MSLIGILDSALNEETLLARQDRAIFLSAVDCKRAGAMNWNQFINGYHSFIDVKINNCNFDIPNRNPACRALL